MKAMTGGIAGSWGNQTKKPDAARAGDGDELAEIKKQLAELQSRLSKL